MTMYSSTLYRSALLLVMLASSGLASAQEDNYQRCNGLYPAETYGAEERDAYIQECVQSSNDAAANPAPPVETATETEPPAYDGTVEQYMGEQTGSSETESVVE